MRFGWNAESAHRRYCCFVELDITGKQATPTAYLG
jgi:hypothetical protein